MNALSDQHLHLRPISATDDQSDSVQEDCESQLLVSLLNWESRLAAYGTLQS